MRQAIKTVCFSFLGALFLALAATSFAQEESTTSDPVQDATEAVEPSVEAETEKATSERRQKILEEAVDALGTTKDALQALEEGRVDEALEALALTTGRLELIIARDPELALAPTDWTVSRYDVLGTVEAVEAAVKAAEEALKEGQLQDARRLLDHLRSELVIEVTNIPLATYPDAIKAISPLIDAGKTEDAIRGLQAALNTLVVTEHVVPLPIVRAQALLDDADELAAKPNRDDTRQFDLAVLIDAVRNQLEMAELLGYGSQKDLMPIHDKLDELEKKAEAGDFGDRFFDSIRNTLSKLWPSIG